MEKRLVKLRTGVLPRRKPAYDLLDERIKNMMKEFDSKNPMPFFENMSLVMKYTN